MLIFECSEKWTKIVPLWVALQALFSALHPCSIYQNFAFFMGQSKTGARVVVLAAISRKFGENPQKTWKLGFLALKTAATGQPMVQNWWNFGKIFFRSKPGCKPKISSVGLPGADWEAQRSKTHFFTCRCKRCIFPNFKAIFKKFNSILIFWHPCHLCRLQFDRKKSNWKKCTKKCDPSSTGNWGFPL